MTFLERLRATVDRGIDGSRDILDRARGKARDLGERGVLRFEISQLETRGEKLAAGLGQRVFELAEEGKPLDLSDDMLADYLSQLREVRSGVETREKQLAELGDKPADPAADETGEDE